MGLAGLRHAARATRPKAYLAQGVLFRALGHLLPELRRAPLRLTPPATDGPAVGDAPVISLADAHPALVSFTSGSSGRPKAIRRTHGFLSAQGAALKPLLASDRPDEVDLVAFPVFALMNLREGVASVLPPWVIRRPDRLDPAATARFVDERRITRLLVPPSVIERLDGARLPDRVARIFTGGGPVYPDLLRRVADIAPRAEPVAVYGSTEAEPIAHVAAHEIAAEDHAHMAAGGGILAGKPVPEVALRIVDDEIQVAGGHVVEGYLDPADDASTKVRDGGRVWHRTGDAGRLDAQGRLWLLGRRDARAGGFYPFEVEVAARTWSGVRRATLVDGAGGPVLAVEGDGDTAEWERRAGQAFPGLRVVRVRSTPMDRRHRSKVDYRRLKTMLR